VDVLADIGTVTVVMLVITAFVAGWVDAVVGGGGLIQLPALMLGLGGHYPVVTALATNKLSSLCGTSTSAVAYYRRVHPDLGTALPMAGLALIGSVGGAVVAYKVPSEVFKPVILILLVAVAIYTWFRPDLGSAEHLRFDGRAHYVTAALAGLVIGFYDGIAGPGTGSFFVFTLVGLLGYAFLEASAKAKIANVATNVGALIVFVPQHAVLWILGLTMGLANLGGGLLGARTAVARGSSFVRVVFLLVVSALILRLGYDVVNELTG
jgi:uncharacterized membrane protein YfcA